MIGFNLYWELISLREFSDVICCIYYKEIIPLLFQCSHKDWRKDNLRCSSIRSPRKPRNNWNSILAGHWKWQWKYSNKNNRQQTSTNKCKYEWLICIKSHLISLCVWNCQVVFLWEGNSVRSSIYTRIGLEAVAMGWCNHGSFIEAEWENQNNHVLLTFKSLLLKT